MTRKEARLSEVLDDLLTAAVPTLDELAREAGVTYDALLLWRQGVRTPRTKNLDALLRVLEERHARVAKLAKEARAARARNPERRTRRAPSE